MARSKDESSTGFLWVDDTWWRDWLFWVAAITATALVGYAVANLEARWWEHVLQWFASFALTAAVLGFGRELVRGFREPRS